MRRSMAPWQRRPDLTENRGGGSGGSGGSGGKSALKKWDGYSAARSEMLARAHTVFAPWTIVRADDTPVARINLIRDMLTKFEFDGKDRQADLADPDIVFTFHEDHLRNGRIAE
jgi:hypothetical protein